VGKCAIVENPQADVRIDVSQPRYSEPVRRSALGETGLMRRVRHLFFLAPEYRE